MEEHNHYPGEPVYAPVNTPPAPEPEYRECDNPGCTRRILATSLVQTWRGMVCRDCAALPDVLHERVLELEDSYDAQAERANDMSQRLALLEVNVANIAYFLRHSHYPQPAAGALPLSLQTPHQDQSPAAVPNCVTWCVDCDIRGDDGVCPENCEHNRTLEDRNTA